MTVVLQFHPTVSLHLFPYMRIISPHFPIVPRFLVIFLSGNNLSLFTLFSALSFPFRCFY